jgi:hypothetical protein
MSILLYKVENKNIVRSTDKTLNEESIYIIVDRSLIRPKIWVWSGAKSNLKDRYFAGVSATTIKSQEKLYGSSIEVVEGGSEPEQFPKLEEGRIIAPSAEEMQVPIPMEEAKIPTVVETATEVSSAEVKVEPEAGQELTQEIQQEVAEEVVEMVPEIKDTPKKAARKRATAESAADRLWKQKMKSFLTELSRDIESIKNKVDGFIADL